MFGQSRTWALGRKGGTLTNKKKSTKIFINKKKQRKKLAAVCASTKPKKKQPNEFCNSHTCPPFLFNRRLLRRNFWRMSNMDSRNFGAPGRYKGYPVPTHTRDLRYQHRLQWKPGTDLFGPDNPTRMDRRTNRPITTSPNSNQKLPITGHWFPTPRRIFPKSFERVPPVLQGPPENPNNSG